MTANSCLSTAWTSAPSSCALCPLGNLWLDLCLMISFHAETGSYGLIRQQAVE